MTLIFDSSILIDLEKGKKETISSLKELALRYPAPVFISFVSYFEFYFGILRRSPNNFNLAYGFLQKFPLLLPTKKTAEILGELRKKYNAQGKILPLADYLIASQAKEHNLTLVTRDKDFGMFEEIKVIHLENI